MQNRGQNTFEHWNEKHICEYGLFVPYDFDEMNGSEVGYHKVASDIIKENKDAIKMKSMLEIGCAGGYFSSYIATLFPNWKIEGWDFSKSGIDAARQKNEHIKNISFKIIDILENPVADDYGIICCFETIEHMAEGDNYKLLNQWLEHCEYFILSVPTTKDDCRGEHISHYDFDTFEKQGYQVIWKAKLGKIDMSNVGDFGEYFHFIALIKGKL